MLPVWHRPSSKCQTQNTRSRHEPQPLTCPGLAVRRRQVDKGSRETHEFVSYFQSELEKKDDTISKLREKLTEVQQSSSEEISRLKVQSDKRPADAAHSAAA